MQHVIVANRPRMFRELLVRFFRSSEDVARTTEIRDADQLAHAKELSANDSIILPADLNRAVAAQIVAAHPEARVVSVSEKGDLAKLSECTPSVHRGISLNDLLSAVAS